MQVHVLGVGYSVLLLKHLLCFEIGYVSMQNQSSCWVCVEVLDFTIILLSLNTTYNKMLYEVDN